MHLYGKTGKERQKKREENAKHICIGPLPPLASTHTLIYLFGSVRYMTKNPFLFGIKRI